MNMYLQNIHFIYDDIYDVLKFDLYEMLSFVSSKNYIPSFLPLFSYNLILNRAVS